MILRGCEDRNCKVCGVRVETLRRDQSRNETQHQEESWTFITFTCIISDWTTLVCSHSVLWSIQTSFMILYKINTHSLYNRLERRRSNIHNSLSAHHLNKSNKTLTKDKNNLCFPKVKCHNFKFHTQLREQLGSNSSSRVTVMVTWPSSCLCDYT